MDEVPAQMEVNDVNPNASASSSSSSSVGLDVANDIYQSDTLIDNLRFRLKDLDARIRSFRAHQMRTVMDSPPDSSNWYSRLMRNSTLAVLDHDFSSIIRLLEKYALTAALGEAISSECFRVYIKAISFSTGIRNIHRERF